MLIVHLVQQAMDGEPGRGGAFSGRCFRGDIVIGGGSDVMSSILGSHFIRLMEGLDCAHCFLTVCVCVCV